MGPAIPEHLQQAVSERSEKLLMLCNSGVANFYLIQGPRKHNTVLV